MTRAWTDDGAGDRQCHRGIILSGLRLNALTVNSFGGFIERRGASWQKRVGRRYSGEGAGSPSTTVTGLVAPVPTGKRAAVTAIIPAKSRNVRRVHVIRPRFLHPAQRLHVPPSRGRHRVQQEARTTAASDDKAVTNDCCISEYSSSVMLLWWRPLSDGALNTLCALQAPASTSDQNRLVAGR